MPRRLVIRLEALLEALQERWRDFPLQGGVSGILSVALATGVIAAACAVIVVVVTLIY